MLLSLIIYATEMSSLDPQDLREMLKGYFPVQIFNDEQLKKFVSKPVPTEEEIKKNNEEWNSLISKAGELVEQGEKLAEAWEAQVKKCWGDEEDDKDLANAVWEAYKKGEVTKETKGLVYIPSKLVKIIDLFANSENSKK